MNHILEPNAELLPSWLDQRSQPSYRASQVRGWLTQRRAQSFDEMSDLPAALRAELNEDFRIWTAQVVRHSATDDGTEKLLLQLADGGRIECVLLRDGQRRTICISTQVGCAMGCVFCASGLLGVKRNLSSGEIIDQFLRLDRLLAREDRITNVVIMGLGEPLANLTALLPALAPMTGLAFLLFSFYMMTDPPTTPSRPPIAPACRADRAPARSRRSHPARR